MKATQQIVAAALLIAPAVLAAPSPWGRGGWHGGWNGHKGHGGWGNDDGWEEDDNTVIPFTSTYSVSATPDQVVNGTTPTGGLPGASGEYDIGLNRDLNLICYYIRLYGFKGEYLSPALTATHIHEAARGASGPPRIAFPNPVKTANKGERISVGCMQGPFMTGVIDNTTGMDTGAGFTVARIEDNPAGFFADVHSSKAVPGAVRGQLA